MSAFKSDFLRTMSERGFIHQTSDDAGLDQLFAREIVTAYIGFDATARSLHAGSLIQIMMLHWLQKTGHRPIALMGGGTSMIGDPSFKDEARKLLTPQDIDDNLVGIFTERHYARKVFLKGRSSPKTLVREVMERDVIYVEPGQSAEACMALMTEKRIRHLPVLRDGRLVGVISIGDLMKSIIADRELNIDQLVRYVQG